MKSKSENPELNSLDYIAASTIFASALGILLDKGEGILIKPKGSLSKHFSKDGGLVLISNDGSKIDVAPLSDLIMDTSDFTEGMIVDIIIEESSEETE